MSPPYFIGKNRQGRKENEENEKNAERQQERFNVLL